MELQSVSARISQRTERYGERSLQTPEVFMLTQTKPENPYLVGKYAPIYDEIAVDNLQVIGEIPKDLNGVYVRNGPNPRYQPKGRYHWFDGDGMLHAVHFENGKASY